MRGFEIKVVSRRGKESGAPTGHPIVYHLPPWANFSDSLISSSASLLWPDTEDSCNVLLHVKLHWKLTSGTSFTRQQLEAGFLPDPGSDEATISPAL